MILCHKCSGVLAGDTTETAGLLDCGCISGWVRGWETPVTREQAITIQIAAEQERRRLYMDQNREKSFWDRCNKRIDMLDALRRGVNS